MWMTKKQKEAKKQEEVMRIEKRSKRREIEEKAKALIVELYNDYREIHRPTIKYYDDCEGMKMACLTLLFRNGAMVFVRYKFNKEGFYDFQNIGIVSLNRDHLGKCREWSISDYTGFDKYPYYNEYKELLLIRSILAEPHHSDVIS